MRVSRTRLPHPAVMVAFKGMDATLTLDAAGVEVAPRGMAQPAKKKAGACRVGWEHITGVDFIPGGVMRPAALRLRIAGLDSPERADLDSWSMQVASRGGEQRVQELVTLVREHAAGAQAVPVPSPRLPQASETAPAFVAPRPPVITAIPQAGRQMTMLYRLTMATLWVQLAALLLPVLLGLALVALVVWVLLFA